MPPPRVSLEGSGLGSEEDVVQRGMRRATLSIGALDRYVEQGGPIAANIVHASENVLTRFVRLVRSESRTR